jgi:hypothetical protein
MSANLTVVRPARAAGLALLVGGALGALVPVLHPGHGPGYYTHPMTAASHLLLFAAVLVVSLGLPGLARTGGAGRATAFAGAALLFVGEWCLDGTHGLVDGAVLPALAARQPAVAAWLAPGHASQDLFANGALGTIVNAGVPLFILGALLLGVTIARARQLPRAVGWGLALGWVLMPPSFVFPVLRAPAVALPYVAFGACGVALLLARRSAP